MKPFGFENLEVWSLSKTLAKDVYHISSKFPTEEKYSLTQQIRRAAVSVSCNLAEGNGRITGKEQARFTEISYGSVLEVMNLLLIAEDLGFLAQEDIGPIRQQVLQLSYKLNRLRQVQLLR